MHERAAEPRPRAVDRAPADVIAWLDACESGGVHVVERSGPRFVGWRSVAADVAKVASHLAASGVRQGTRVGIRGHNRYEWLVLDLALLKLGAVPVALPVAEFAGTSTEELRRRYGIAVMFADPKGRGADDEAAVPLEELLALPPFRCPDTAPAPEGARTPSGEREVFTLAFSSGTAGRVKCLLLAWEGVAALVEAHSKFHPLRGDDRILVALPLSTFQQRYLCYLAIRNGCDVVLTTSSRFLQALRGARPTFLLGPPNYYEFAHRRYSGLPAPRRLLLDAAAGAAGLLPHAGLRRRWRRWVFRSFHDDYGGSARLMLVGSAPVAPDMLRFFRRAGFELYEIYGMTEVGYIAWNGPGADRIGSVGREVYPGSVSTGPDGEILVRHPWHLCVGYEGESASDAEQVLVDRDTVATGDLGVRDEDGFLHMQGRKKNLVITTGGDKVQLEDLEADLCRVEGANRAAIVESGAGSGYDAVVWYSGDESAVGRGVLRRIQTINARLGRDTAIAGLALVEGDLEADSPLLNRNLKVSRAAVRDAFGDRATPITAWTPTKGRHA